MMMRRYARLILLILLLMALCVAGLTGCSKDKDNNPAGPSPSADRADCQGCHEDESMLRLTAIVDSLRMAIRPAKVEAALSLRWRDGKRSSWPDPGWRRFNRAPMAASAAARATAARTAF